MLGNLRNRLTGTRRARITVITAVAVIIALVSAGLVLIPGSSGTQVTAYFNEAVGVYPGSTVRILGVQVGTIDSVQPMGQQVKVTMTVNSGVPVPARADAVVVAASVVSDRYVQLTPPYTGGPRLAGNAVIPASRTATPVEVDQLYASLTKLANGLGPNGVNANGALSDVIKTGAANLAGSNGTNFNNMISQLGQATRTLSGSRDNFFSTINNLQKFTTMLKDSNSQVVLAQQQLAQVFGFLSNDRQALAGALSQLATALGQVKSFIANNRSLITSNVTKLAAITQLLVNERASLAQAVNYAPLAVDNVLGAYNPVTRTLNGRGNLLELEVGQNGTAAQSSVAAAATAATRQSATSPAAATAAGALASVSPQLQASLPPLPLPAVGPVYGSGSAVRGNGG